jgi:hypothetical protein
MMDAALDLNQAIEQVERAGQEGKLSEGAVANLPKWLSEPRDAEYAPRIGL